MTNETPAEVLLTPAEVAAMFCVEPKTVTRWAVAGKIHAVRTMGGHRRYRRSEIDALMARLAQQPESARADQLLSGAEADSVPAQVERRGAAQGVAERAAAALEQSDPAHEPVTGQPAAALDALRRASRLRSATENGGLADEGAVAAAETVEAAIAALASKVAAAAVVFERRVAEAREALQAISAAAERAAAVRGDSTGNDTSDSVDADTAEGSKSRGLASDVMARVAGPSSF